MDRHLLWPETYDKPEIPWDDESFTLTLNEQELYLGSELIPGDIQRKYPRKYPPKVKKTPRTVRWCRSCGHRFVAHSKVFKFCDHCRGLRDVGRNYQRRIGLTLDEVMCLIEEAGGRCQLCGRHPTRYHNHGSLFKLLVTKDGRLVCPDCHYNNQESIALKKKGTPLS